MPVVARGTPRRAVGGCDLEGEHKGPIRGPTAALWARGGGWNKLSVCGVARLRRTGRPGFASSRRRVARCCSWAGWTSNGSSTSQEADQYFDGPVYEAPNTSLATGRRCGSTTSSQSRSLGGSSASRANGSRSRPTGTRWTKLPGNHRSDHRDERGPTGLACRRSRRRSDRRRRHRRGRSLRASPARPRALTDLA
jgi:hypothetical protein